MGNSGRDFDEQFEALRERLRGGRPRVVRDARPPRRGRRVLLVIVGVLIVLLASASTLLRLRVDYLFLDTLGHSNVFWTPAVAQLLLFLAGLVLGGGLTALNIPFWRRAARSYDAQGARLVGIVGIVLALVVGIASGLALAGDWQTVLLWIHGHAFGRTDPVFGQDFSFFLFTLPVLDSLQGIAWGAVVVGLLGTLALVVLGVALDTAPRDVELPFRPPAGEVAREGVARGARHAGALLAAVFVLAALGAHFGVYHLALSTHENYVGLDATERNVTRPVLGALQVLALVLAVVTVAILVRRRRAAAAGTGIALAGLLVGWLVVAGLAQSVPAAIYGVTSVNPNAQQAQSPTISDFLATSRIAWGLEDTANVQRLPFSSKVSAPTLSDLASDQKTLANVRVQDPAELPEIFSQTDRSRNYQSFPGTTVDRYLLNGQETEVMLSTREIAEDAIPNTSFVGRSLIFTHGYGFSAVSVNQTQGEGRPVFLAGGQPLQAVAGAQTPPDLTLGGDGAQPQTYCGLATGQPVVVNTSQPEFDFPQKNSDQTIHAGTQMVGITNPGGIDRLALSLTQFGGTDLFLTSVLSPESTVLLHREIKNRVQTIAPFLGLDGDPYVVVDPATKHLFWVADAYVSSDQFPEAFRQSDGTSYMRNAVKAVVDARTCATTLYAVDQSEPLTAAWSEIFPGLLHPLSEIPASLRAHLRYPEDLFKAQTQAYATVHITDPAVLYQGSDRWRVSEQRAGDNTGTEESPAYYVELTLPQETNSSFVLLRTYAPSGTANNMTSWLAARCDYTSTDKPKLVSVQLDAAANILGPMQFDNNINTDPKISGELTLLGQRGSNVTLGNTIVLPFNNRSFLYVRPLYVKASNGSFPQLQRVIVGKQDKVADGATLGEALQALYSTTTPIPGLPAPPAGSTSPSPSPGGSPSPSASPSGGPGPSASPGPSAAPSPLSGDVQGVLNDLLQRQAAAEQALRNGDLQGYAREEQLVSQDAARLRTLLGQASPAPAAAATAAPGSGTRPTP